VSSGSRSPSGPSGTSPSSTWGTTPLNVPLAGGPSEWRIEAAWTASRLLGDPELAGRCLELAARDEPSAHLEVGLARAQASLFSDLEDGNGVRAQAHDVFYHLA
jgi:hypothetical protein